jgi:predicted glycogen debranching enzyme
LCPYFNFRPISLSVNAPIIQPYITTIIKNRYEVSSKEFPTVRMFVQGDETGFIFDEHIVKNVYFQKEASRGEVSLGEFWSPGSLTVKLQKNKQVAFLASIENWEDIDSFNSFQALQYEQMRREHLLKKPPEMLRKGFGAELVLAADQFIMVPASRTQDKVRAKATGDQVRTVAAGYHWFADWGRDTMISLEGLTLCTGRFEEARWILRTFAYYVRNGLIPNMFPEGENQGLYHTADASLWFFHALNRYLERVNDQETLEFILPKLLEIYDYHLRGTLFGIRADPIDGLVTQGAEGYQLTWMDAKVDNWVVTPRRGKAVEINALWYNALRLLEKWLMDIKKEEVARQIGELANKVYVSFNQKFWNEKKGCLFDVIEGEKGNDDAVRPNQLFSISLEYPVLDPKYWKEVFEVCKRDLLTPVGLRSLSPHHPDYKSRYDGDLRARDSAYHQGTVWSWLIGPYIDVWLKIYPQDSAEAHEFLNGFREHLSDAGVGYISEIFDATEPYQARGCIAQAWSIAELLRCLVKTEPQK